SKNYKLLQVVEEIMHNFKSWKMKDNKLNNYAEMAYLSKFANILGILLEDEDITVYDGETVSKVTQRMQDKGNGRKID
ncbi:MAG: hypothetical protein EXX96DRAFT_461792, partial [Benjaminiella poitrasii]